jgi:hypothetical protein
MGVNIFLKFTLTAVCRIAATLILMKCLYVILAVDISLRERGIPTTLEAFLAILFLISSISFRYKNNLFIYMALSVIISFVEIFDMGVFVFEIRSYGFSYEFILENHWPGIILSLIFTFIFGYNFIYILNNNK